MNSKDKISLSALKIFLQKGYDATSISDVVTECKITRGGIYHHFKNKEDLFIDAIDYLFESITDSENIDVKNFYMLMTNAFIKFPQVRKKHGKLHLKNQEIMVETIRKAQQDGEIKDDIDCETMAFMINALAEGTMIYHIGTDEIDLKEKGEKIFQNLWRGISTEK